MGDNVKIMKKTSNQITNLKVYIALQLELTVSIFFVKSGPPITEAWDRQQIKSR